MIRARALVLCVGTALVCLAPAVSRAQESKAPARSSRLVTLAQVERMATTLQPQVAVARAQTSVAEAVADQARAPLLPQVTGTAQYTRQTGNYVARPGAIPGGGLTGAPSPSLLASYDYWSFGVSATQLVYDFGQQSSRYRAAETSAEAARIEEQVLRLQLVFGVRRAYFDARAAKDMVGVAQEALDDQNRHLEQVDGFVRAGTQPEIALAQQRAAVANAQVLLITAQNAYETTKAQLNQAAGLTGSTDYDVGDEVLGPVDGEDLPRDALLARAIATRPELANLSKQRQAQEEALRAARGGYGPTLSAVAGATEQGTALGGLVPNWSAGALLAWPVFQGGLTEAEVRQAEAGLHSLDAQRSLEELQVRVEVDSARLAVRAASATIGAANDALVNAREQLRLAEQRYATGVGSIIELVDAQVVSTNAAAQVVQARYGLATARAQLLATLGRT